MSNLLRHETNPNGGDDEKITAEHETGGDVEERDSPYRTFSPDSQTADNTTLNERFPYMETVYDPQFEGMRRRRTLIAVAATGVIALGGGIFFGLRNGNESPEAKAPPVATAPANSGEEFQTSSPDTSQEVQAATSVETMTAENVPLEFNGEIYVGVEAFEKAIAVSAAEYPTPEEAAPVLIERWNTWINYGNTPEADKLYYGYAAHDLQAYSQRGIAQDYVDPAFTEALFGEPPVEGEVLNSTDSLKELLKKLHIQNLQSWSQTRKDEKKYYAGFSPEGKKTTTTTYPLKDGGTLSVADIFLHYTDNADENKVGEIRKSKGQSEVIDDHSVIHVVLHANEQGNWQIVGSLIESNN